MKKTFLISLFLLFTSSVFAVSIPGGGLGTEDNFSDNYFYFEGFGLRSAEQVGDEAGEDNPWKGTWDATGEGRGTAVEAMGMSPDRYAYENWKRWGVEIGGDVYYTPNIFDSLVSDVVGECTYNGGDLLDCKNYAVDVYNIAIGQYYETDLGRPKPTYKDYFAAPVSTDVALMAMFAGAYLAFALWRKKRSVAKI